MDPLLRPARLLLLGAVSWVLSLSPGCFPLAHAAEPEPTALVSLPDAPAPSPEASVSPDIPPSTESSSLASLGPSPALELASPSSSAGLSQAMPDRSSAPMTQRETDLACQAGTLHGKPCRASWGPVLWEFFEATAMENAGNIALDDETRHDLLTRPFLSTWFKCVHQFRYKQWRDDDDFMVDYIGHGMQGAIIGASLYQHSPTGRGLVYVNNGNYWRSRLKGMAWIAVYEVQWKIGPASESSIGNSGLNTYYTPRVKGRSTNETGFQDFVDTPLVGVGWNVGEDAIDRFIMPHVWRHTHNKWALTGYSVLTPCKAVANILRFKPFYYRDFDLPPVHSAAVIP